VPFHSQVSPSEIDWPALGPSPPNSMTVCFCSSKTIALPQRGVGPPLAICVQVWPFHAHRSA